MVLVLILHFAFDNVLAIFDPILVVFSTDSTLAAAAPIANHTIGAAVNNDTKTTSADNKGYTLYRRQSFSDVLSDQAPLHETNRVHI